MNTLATPPVPATAPRAIVADPDETPDYSGVEPGGILVWTNRSQKYPMFEIQFIGPSPISPGDVLTGSGAVVVHVPATPATEDATFYYKIRHIPTQGHDKILGTFSVRSCSGC
jgi:hypothetical protein